MTVGHHTRRVAIRGLPADGQLLRLMNAQGETTEIPPGGLVISKKLAEILDVKVGESIRVEVLEEKRPEADVPVVALLQDISGLNAYMEIGALHRLMREGPVVNGAYLQTDSAMEGEVYHELKNTPYVAAVSVKTSALETFQNTLSKNMMRMRMINLTFSIIIAVGVVYNSAQISLSERSRELATLRVIGFTRAEISTILLGEIGTVTFLAIPLGLVIGHFMAMFLATFLDQEVFRFPFVIENSTYGLAATAVLTTSVICALFVRRELDHLDLIAVLKSRE
jgi:putative ABC transport system permease protein